MLGRQIMIPHKIITGTQNPIPTSYGNFVDTLRQNLQKAHDTIRKYLKSHTEWQIERTDPKINLHRYKTGDLVWCLQAPVTGLAPKLQKTYQGPYLVIKCFNDNDYLIKNKQKNKANWSCSIMIIWNLMRARNNSNGHHKQSENSSLDNNINPFPLSLPGSLIFTS